MVGRIVNPRGTAGSGKSALVRRILAEDLGWDGGAWTGAVPCGRGRGGRPLGHVLRRPGGGGAPLAVLGDYRGRTRGGCDTIRAADGGLDAVLELAGALAATGHDVLMEGLQLSAEHARSADLARHHRLHVLRLDTSTERCAAHLAARWHARRDARPRIAAAVARQREAVEHACARLRDCGATVEVVDPEAALCRARALLGLGGVTAG